MTPFPGVHKTDAEERELNRGDRNQASGVNTQGTDKLQYDKANKPTSQANGYSRLQNSLKQPG